MDEPADKATMAGDYPRRLARSRYLGWLKRNWMLITPLALFFLGVSFAIYVLWRSELGVVVSTTVVVGGFAGIGYLALILSGAHQAVIGMTGEEWTAGELRHLNRHGWKIFHGLRFLDRDVDHVAVGSHGVAVFETKFTDQSLETRDGAPHWQIEKAVRQVEWAERKIRLLLHSYGVTCSPRAVVFVWGLRTGDVSRTFRVGDTDVAVGYGSIRDFVTTLQVRDTGHGRFDGKAAVGAVGSFVKTQKKDFRKQRVLRWISRSRRVLKLRPPVKQESA